LQDSARRLMEESRETTDRLFGRKVVFYRPEFHGPGSKSFPTFSVTGPSCALQCEHCKAQVLKSMKPTLTPDALYEGIMMAFKAGATGCLVSGGSRPDGSVPLERFVEAIRRAKADTRMKIVVHTGLVRRETAFGLARAGVDAALIDLLGDERSIQSIYHLSAGLDDYRRAVRDLVEAGISLTPHFIVGLGSDGEAVEKVLDMLEGSRPKAFIVIALRPLPSTPMSLSPPPSPRDVAVALAKARLRLRDVPLALGCMRPVGKLREEMDRAAIEVGANAIAHPTKAAYEAAAELGCSVTEKFSCCSQVFEDMVL